MINALTNIKWIILLSIICISTGIITFFTFVNQSFIELNDLNLQILLILNLLLFILFFTLIVYKTFKILSERKQQKIGSKTSLRYIFFFSLSTLLPSFIIAIFSLILFNVGLQNYFNKQITSAVNNSYDVAKNYVEDSRNAIQADTLLVAIDINRNAQLLYDNPSNFRNLITSQRLLRRLDEIYLLDSTGEILFSDIVDITRKYVPPPEDALNQSISGKPVKITDAITNRTSAVVKLSNFIDTYLYIVRFMDPKVIGYLKETEQAINFYYSVEDKRTGIKITFVLIYIIIVALLLFLSIVIAINFASRLTKPIINLITASELISSGDLNAKVPIIKSDEELEKLSSNFNLMIDRLKKQQDRLLTTERHEAWESVARKLAHEIKNPLTPIQLSIDRIKEKYLDKIDVNKNDFEIYLNTINKQIKDIEKLVNEFSDFARMPSPVFNKFDIFILLDKLIKLNILSHPNIKFNIIAKEKKYFINGDEEQLNRVFLNLLKNSIESIQEKSKEDVDFHGKIDVDIYDDNDYIYIVIQDNGVGFDQKNLKKIVTPYFTTKKEGTGLGLAIVNKVINDHDSDIKFISNNNGATVEISISKKND